MARLTCGDELRKRLEELNGKDQCSHSNEIIESSREPGNCQNQAI
jgi:hypothetical protein